MDPQAVFAKTALGVQALSHRDHELSRTLRHALILVDGHSTVAELEVKGAIIPEFLGALRDLVAKGLITRQGPGATAEAVPSPAGPVGMPLLHSLVDLAESILGEKSVKIVKKLVDAAASRDELSAAVDGCYKLIRLTIDESKAEEFRKAAKEAIARGG